MTWNRASAQQLRESYHCFWRILWWTNSPEIILSLKIVQELVYFLFFEAEKMNARRLSRTFIKIVWLKSEEIGLVAEPVRLKSERGLKNTPKEKFPITDTIFFPKILSTVNWKYQNIPDARVHCLTQFPSWLSCLNYTKNHTVDIYIEKCVMNSKT